MIDEPFIRTEAATWLARGRSESEAIALAQAWRDFPDLMPDAPLEARMARTRRRIEALRPITDATARRTDEERQARNFGFVRGKMESGTADQRERAILRGRDEHGYDWDCAVRYADGWYAAQAGWPYRFYPAMRRNGVEAARSAYDQGFRLGGGEPDNLFDVARRSLRAEPAPPAPTTAPVGRLLPSTWPKPTDDGRPALWQRRLAILSEFDPSLAGDGSRPVMSSASLRDEIRRRSTGAAQIILLSAAHGFIAGEAAAAAPHELTAERAVALIGDPEQRRKLRLLIADREYDDLFVAAQGEHLRVIDAFADALPLCRRMERTRNTPLQQRAHLRTWLDRGIAVGAVRGAGHIRWGKLAKGLTGKLGEFTARYGGKVPPRGHRILIELADGQPADGYAAVDGKPLAHQIIITNKSRLRDEMTNALRAFGGATRLIGQADCRSSRRAL